MTTQQRRPFHETIIDAILTNSGEELRCLGQLIVKTKIPRNHDKIIGAWNRRLRELGASDSRIGVVANLLEQKKETEEQEEAKKRAERPSEFGDF